MIIATLRSKCCLLRKVVSQLSETLIGLQSSINCLKLAYHIVFRLETEISFSDFAKVKTSDML